MTGAISVEGEGDVRNCEMNEFELPWNIFPNDLNVWVNGKSTGYRQFVHCSLCCACVCGY